MARKTSETGRAKRTRTTIEKEELPPRADEELDEEAAFELDASEPMPLIDSPEDGDGPAYLAVHRVGPIDEGLIGRLPGNAQEADLERMAGGGLYRIEPRNSRGRFVRGLHSKQVSIAGEPKFQSEKARKEYELELARLDKRLGESGRGNGANSMGDLVTLLDIRGKQAEDEHRRSIEAMEHRHKLEVDLLTQQRTLDREAAERQRKADQESFERQAERDREFVKALMQANGGSQGVEMLMAGVQLASKMQGTGDPVSELIKALPEILEGVRSTAETVADQVKGNKSLPSTTATEPAKRNPSRPRRDGAPSATLRGPIVAKFARFAKMCEAKGLDAEERLGRALDVMSKHTDDKQRPSPPSEAEDEGAAQDNAAKG